MVRKNRGMYGFWGTSGVLITYNICLPGNTIRAADSSSPVRYVLVISVNIP